MMCCADVVISRVLDIEFDLHVGDWEHSMVSFFYSAPFPPNSPFSSDHPKGLLSFLVFKKRNSWLNTPFCFRHTDPLRRRRALRHLPLGTLCRVRLLLGRDGFLDPRRQPTHYICCEWKSCKLCYGGLARVYDCVGDCD